MSKRNEGSALVAIRELRATEDRPIEPASSRFEDSLRAQPYSWLGITAGVTMLVGALALVAATRMHPMPSSAPVFLERAAVCPPPAVPAAVQPEPAAQSPTHPPIRRPHTPPNHRPPELRPIPAAKPCDGTDPLCGIDSTWIDDPAKTAKRHRPR